MSAKVRKAVEHLLVEHASMIPTSHLIELREALGEPPTVEVTGMVPGPMMALHVIGVEVSAVEHEALGDLQILTLELPAGGHCNAIYPLAQAEMFATAIIDGAVAARAQADAGTIERVDPLWIPPGPGE